MNVVLVVTGSIAAYKAIEVARLLVKAGVNVLPVLTRSAAQFVGATTFAGVTGNAARGADDMWDPAFSGEMHVALAAQADVVAIVPATADLLARLAEGRADDLATALVLCASCPILAAPAMHPRMWEHPATVANVATLARQGRVELVGPVFGEVANGERGLGRMAEPVDIVAAITSSLRAARDLEGKHVVVTAGPTLEDVDAVRFLGNRSTGKMGFAVAARAAARGAKVTLIAGPVSLATPAGVTRVDVRGALDMEAALEVVLGPNLEGADALVMAAAVADYRPKDRAPGKLKKQGETASLELVRNPDLLAAIGARRSAGARRPTLIGFAVETGSPAEVTAYARGKLVAKKVDLVVANAASDAFGNDDNVAILVSADSETPLGKMPKTALSDRILDFIRAH